MALLDFLRRTPTIKRAVVINGITMELEIKGDKVVSQVANITVFKNGREEYQEFANFGVDFNADFINQIKNSTDSVYNMKDETEIYEDEDEEYTENRLIFERQKALFQKKLVDKVLNGKNKKGGTIPFRSCICCNIRIFFPDYKE